MNPANPAKPPQPAVAASRGDTITARGSTPQPGQPNERDESSHSQAPNEGQADTGCQAYKDAKGPTTDTDKGPLLDKVYNESVAPDRDDAPPRQ